MAGSGRKSEDKKQEKTALEAAYAFIAARMKTVRETENHLAAKGYKQREIQEAVNDLIGLRYLDDYQYALRYYEYNRGKHRGTLRAMRELAEKGVDAETVRNAREDFIYSNDIDEFRDALGEARKELMLRSEPGEDEEDLKIRDERTAGRIARKLETKGFPRDIIFKVLERLGDRN